MKVIFCNFTEASRWFKDSAGKKWWMEFHHYLGPSFNTEGPDGDDWTWSPPNEVMAKFELWLKRYKRKHTW